MTSKETRTLVCCTSQLELGLEGYYKDVARFFFEKSWISRDRYEEIIEAKTFLTPRDKICMVVSVLRKKVELNGRNYTIFVDYLRSNTSRYGNIVQILDHEYRGLQGPSPALHYERSLGQAAQKQAAQKQAGTHGQAGNLV